MPKQQTDASRKRESIRIVTFGYLIFFLAIIGLAVDLLQRRLLSLPVDIGVVFGSSAFALTGLLATMVGSSLRKIEERLEKIEEVPEIDEMRKAWIKQSAIRSWIIQSIGRILADESFSEEDFKAQPAEGWEQIKSKSSFIRSDRNPAHSAWLALQHWINDDDIRAKDPTYADSKKRQLENLLRMIEDEVA
jgi:hypothetical protein